MRLETISWQKCLGVVVILVALSLSGCFSSDVSYRIGDSAMEKHDPAEADRWYKRAMQKALPLAQAGKAEDQLVVGKLYRGGKGVKKDYSEAVKWLQKAADQGNGEALIILAQIKAEQLEAEALKIKEQQAAEAEKLREQQEAEAKQRLEAEQVERAKQAKLAEAAAAEERGDYVAALKLWKELSNQEGVTRVQPKAKQQEQQEQIARSKAAQSEALVLASAHYKVYMGTYELLKPQLEFNEKYGAPPVSSAFKALITREMPSALKELSACHNKLIGKPITDDAMNKVIDTDKTLEAMKFFRRIMQFAGSPRVPKTSKDLDLAPNFEMMVKSAVAPIEQTMKIKSGANWCSDFDKGFNG